MANIEIMGTNAPKLIANLGSFFNMCISAQQQKHNPQTICGGYAP